MCRTRRFGTTRRTEPAAASGGGGKSGAPEKAVWVLDANNRPRRVAITAGESDGTFTEVVSGALNDGDRVILAALSATPTSGGNPGATPRAGGRGPGF